MKLNIRLMSHPIIQSICEKFTHQETFSCITDQSLKNLGLLIIYETMRNWIKTYKISIQQMQSRGDFIITDPKESYIIIFNNLKHLSFFYEIKDLLPKSELILIRENEAASRSSNASIELPKINSCTKIIISLSQLNAVYAIEVIRELIKQYKVQISQIRLTSIICREDELIKLGEQYSYLNVYTSKIIPR